MSTTPPPKVAGGILNISSHRNLRSPFFRFYDTPTARYGVYNQRLYPLDLGGKTLDEYWLLRRNALLYDVPERPLEISGPDAVKLLDRVLVRRTGNLAVNRAAYGLACGPDGGLLMDGVLMRLAEDRFWYVMADGEFLPWLEAFAVGLDVRVGDPGVWVLQIQGPRSLEVLQAVADPAPGSDWKYFGVATSNIAGQPVVLSRTGWTGELGFEIYTPIDGRHNDALWQCLLDRGARFGMRAASLASMTARRIEAGILDYGTDIDRSLNPWQAGLGRFVDMDRDDFMGRAALLDCDRALRLSGVRCDDGVPRRGSAVFAANGARGHITSSARSPQLDCGIGYVRFEGAAPAAGTALEIETDLGLRRAALTVPPFFDPEKRLARGLTLEAT
jgi:aminomethyltransferase